MKRVQLGSLYSHFYFLLILRAIKSKPFSWTSKKYSTYCASLISWSWHYLKTWNSNSWALPPLDLTNQRLSSVSVDKPSGDSQPHSSLRTTALDHSEMGSLNLTL